MKLCPRCGEVKEIGEFGRDRSRKSGHRTECRVCRANYERDRYTRLDTRQHSRRRADIYRHHGLTPEQYQEMFDLQGGVCSICGREETAQRNGKVKALHVDHDHVTGKIRGLLCARCNTAIGLMREDEDTLLSAVAYLQSWWRAQAWEDEEREQRGRDRDHHRRERAGHRSGPASHDAA